MKRRVLVVDEQKGFSALLGIYLEDLFGYEVVIEDRCDRAKAIFLQAPPDIVLMGTCSDRHVSAAFEQFVDDRNIPLIYLLDSLDLDGREELSGSESGRFVLVKPVSTERVASAIENALRENDLESLSVAADKTDRSDPRFEG